MLFSSKISLVFYIILVHAIMLTWIYLNIVLLIYMQGWFCIVIYKSKKLEII